MFRSCDAVCFSSCRGAALLTAVAFLCWPGLAAAAAPTETKPVKNEKDKEKESPKWEDLVLQTSDDLQLTLTYYHGTKGKQTIPVVLLHGWKQSRNDYKDLAPALQAQGYAVIVPDLRGHGESTHLKGVRGDENLKAATMPPAQFMAMVTRDMVAVKKFLWERNNAGELNIDKLCVVGAEMGASVAVNFALADALDQDNNRVLRSDYQLGRFVKALVLISPEHVSHGLPIRALSAGHPRRGRLDPGRQAGQQGPRRSQANPRHVREVPPRAHRRQQDRPENALFRQARHELAGHQAIGPEVQRRRIIADFIDRRLVKSEESRDWPWQERKVPHG